VNARKKSGVAGELAAIIPRQSGQHASTIFQAREGRCSEGPLFILATCSGFSLRISAFWPIRFPPFLAVRAVPAVRKRKK